jgi:Restriction endonuclease EcoRV
LSTWPLTANDPQDLEAQLTAGGHLLPLPKEPAALANVLEVSIVNFLLDRLARLAGASFERGTERGYPDLELTGPAFGGGYHAIDVKAAQRAKTKGRPRTQSRITLYTGNTYFKWPDLHWPGTFRPFNEYTSHLDIILIYTLNTESAWRVDDLEVIVQEPWRIASRQRSSTTREYIGAVDGLDALRAGHGEFALPMDFYEYWRRYPFKISAQVQKQLDRLVKRQHEEILLLRSQRETSDPGQPSGS